MATTIVSTSTTPTLANFKKDCEKLAEIFGKGTYPANIVSIGTIAALAAIAASGDTTDLRTT